MDSKFVRVPALLVLAAALLASGCTLVKPVVDAVAYPPTMVAQRSGNAVGDVADRVHAGSTKTIYRDGRDRNREACQQQ